MAVANPIRRLTETEHLDLERHADARSEFFGGEMFAMSGGEWLLREVAGLSNRLSLASLEVTLALTEVFANVEFTPTSLSSARPAGS